MRDNVKRNIKESIALYNLKRESKVRNIKISGVVTIVLLVGLFVMVNNTSRIDRLSDVNVLNNTLDSIVINEISEVSNDLAVEFKALSTIPDELEFLSKIDILSEYKISEIYGVYVWDEDTLDFTSLHDNSITYELDDKDITVSVSSIEYPLECTVMDGSVSKISGVEMLIGQTGDIFDVKFYYENKYYDIKTYYLDVDELKSLLGEFISVLEDEK